MSPLGDETRYYEGPTMRTNVWPQSVYEDALDGFQRSGSSQSGTSTKPSAAAAAPDEAFPMLFISAQSSIASDLGSMPDLEYDSSDYGGHLATSSESSRGTELGPVGWDPYGPAPGRSESSLTAQSADLANLQRDGFAGSGHLDTSSESSGGHLRLSDSGHLSLSTSGHLDISSESSGGHRNLGTSGHLSISSISSLGVTPVGPALQAGNAVDEAYRAAEQSISAAYWDHGKFMTGYNEVKEAMTQAGSVDVTRLGTLLAREEEAIRSAYGRTKWQSYNKDFGVSSYTASRIQNARDDTLAWIKSEQRSMGLPSKRSSVARLKSWASKTFAKKGGQPEVPRHLMDAIAEDDENTFGG